MHAHRALPILLGLACTLLPAATPTDSAARVDSAKAELRAMEKSLVWRSGEIKLQDDLATLKLEKDFRYLDPAESEKVLAGMWGNPPGIKTLGMIFAPGVSPLAEDSWGVIVTFEEDGFVKDGDAKDLDYDKLLKDMKKDSKANNAERVKQGYEPVELIGWAEKPSYDAEAHKLHWAKELRFGESEVHTLNYNIRILGRRGVLVLNAVSTMAELAQVKEGVKPILAAVEFNQGHRYADFNPKLDKVATYGIAGLVAGTVLAKAGLFKGLLVMLLAFKKFFVLAAAGLAVWLRKLFGKPSAQKEVKEETRVVQDETRGGPKA